MILYNKLVRDKIPNIILSSGKKYDIRVLSDSEYLLALNEKLMEEVQEYFLAGDLSELADVTEVIYSIIKYKGLTVNEFETIRLKKRYDRGGFEKKIMLISVKE